MGNAAGLQAKLWLPQALKPGLSTTGNGKIEVEKGDITAQKVDVIIGTSSSEILKKAIINAAGDVVRTADCRSRDLVASVNYKLPETWVRSTGDKILFPVSKANNEYESICTDFDKAMKGKSKQMIKIERIQNERWYIQYLAHSQGFRKRLNGDTEMRLYHGCSQEAANAIIHSCFNRSFAGMHGTAYGYGVYFSSNAAYSHDYTNPNFNGERCMFAARVLIGKTIRGNSSMRTQPIGYDSTTDEKHIFVTYHDAQA
ncbi:unnamed protein product [Didymodactylos carnosus]|uniref:Poly [ADP-ribose] polymerase n=1 Tax=Didymodactylos carnosus TaxID=1234261 RepID=A0A814R3H0_9BILA|nr:unnamed protein product [Didymodactylos carnosus]CAF1126505.1 unnamed protein product [Didymodactylos carnosus]CAF3890053.1 unnamed protein product [Didymodactylos carnosus]CAF3902873.1 unnamed protein product [Didymodactylos carnosus]